MSTELEIYFTVFDGGRCANLGADAGATDAASGSRRVEVERLIATSTKVLYHGKAVLMPLGVTRGADMIADYQPFNMAHVKDVMNRIGEMLDRVCPGRRVISDVTLQELDAFEPIFRPFHHRALSVATRELALLFKVRPPRRPRRPAERIRMISKWPSLTLSSWIWR